MCPAHNCLTVDGRCQRCLEEAAQGVYLITDYPEIVRGCEKHSKAAEVFGPV